MSTVLQIENVSKMYRLGLTGASTLAEDLRSAWASVTGKKDPALLLGELNDREHKGHSNYVWAIKDISFKINQGEVVGIIGKNGAGKSTLLKILSRVTLPTEGAVKVKGRIASLLEVGTGFHPELSGRDNIYLNGAILGMTRAEIRSKFDEIVAFSGVERYIDTPVKRYSSGMYVRLAFAVAAHLEPEILIVDEVLAVGDIEFQRKCLGKMNDVSRSGRTVLFVSHNMSSIMELCTRGVFLKQGQLVDDGPIEKIVSAYLHANSNKFGKSLEKTERNGNGNIRFTSWDLFDTSGKPITNAMSGQDTCIHVNFTVPVPGNYPTVHFSLRVVDDFDRNIFHLSTTEALGQDFRFAPDRKSGTLIITIPALPLPAGIYNFHLFCSDLTNVFDDINFAGELKVEHGNFFGNGKVLDGRWGIVYQKSNWQLL